MSRELGQGDRRVDVDAVVDRLQPELVRAARVGANEREELGSAWVRDVVEPEAAIGVRARAVLEADRSELTREARRRRVLDDRLLGPGAANAQVGPSVREGGDVPRMLRLGEAVDADALGRAARSVPARQV